MELKIEGGIGERVRLKRLVLRLSQKKLAEMMDVSLPTVACWESGAKNPMMKNLLKLEKLLAIDVLSRSFIEEYTNKE